FGIAPYTWTVVSGSLPAGFALDKTTGVITGTTTNVGPYSFGVQITDSVGGQATKSYAMSVTTGFTITTQSLLKVIASLGFNFIGPYSQSLTAAGGTAPYQWAITAGSLPPGLTLDPSTGIISGQTTHTGVYGINIQTQDATAQITTKAFTLQVDS